VHAAIEQGLHRLNSVEKDERPQADPDQINVAKLIRPFYQLLEEF